MVVVAKSCLTGCNPMDYSPPGSSVHGISQTRILEWVCHFLLQGIFLDQGSNPGLHKSFATEPDVCLVTQSYLILCHPLDCSLPALLVRGIFQAKKKKKWSGLPFSSSRGSSQSRYLTQVSCVSLIVEGFFTTESKLQLIDATQVLHCGGFPGGSVVKSPLAIQEFQVRSLSREDSLKEGIATNSSILAWRISRAEEPGGLQSIRSQRARHD